jgi:hypothetical protein
LIAPEVRNGYPVHHAQSSVAIWAALEILVEDVAVGFLLNFPKARKSESLSRIKVSWADVEALTEEELMRLLIKNLEVSSGAENRAGIGRFEAVLTPLGFSLDVDTRAKKYLFELKEVRNIILHRGSVADASMCSKCPWLGLTAGESLVVTHDMFHIYDIAAHDFVGSMLRSFEKLDGVPTPFSHPIEWEQQRERFYALAESPKFRTLGNRETDRMFPEP